MTTPPTPTMPPVGAPPSPKSRLSGTLVIVIVVVVVLVLGGIGVLVAEAVKSKTTPELTGPAANPGSSSSSGGPGRSAGSGHLVGSAPSSAHSTNSGSTRTKTTTSVKLAGGAAVQPVPTGWTSKSGGDGAYIVLYKQGFWVYTEVAKSEADATAQVGGMLTSWVVNDDHYTQVLVSDPNPLDVADPFTSAANLAYNGLYTSQSGSSSVYGILIAFVRSDGLVLRMQLEAFSATDTADAQARFQAGKDDITKVLGVIDSFASTA